MWWLYESVDQRGMVDQLVRWLINWSVGRLVGRLGVWVDQPKVATGQQTKNPFTHAHVHRRDGVKGRNRQSNNPSTHARTPYNNIQ